eukprot:scaffold571_cov364-Prasinococcus_capsulatus_cf.AAC.12
MTSAPRWHIAFAGPPRVVPGGACTTSRYACGTTSAREAMNWPNLIQSPPRSLIASASRCALRTWAASHVASQVSSVCFTAERTRRHAYTTRRDLSACKLCPRSIRSTHVYPSTGLPPALAGAPNAVALVLDEGVVRQYQAHNARDAGTPHETRGLSLQ